MSPSRPRPRSSKSRVFEATEPRSYDRRFYAGALAAAFIVIMLAAGFAVYRVAFNTEKTQPQSAFDLGSLAVGGAVQPDPANPCIVLQDHIEATRRASYRLAYGFFCEGLKKITSFDDFVANARTNSILFRDVAGYDCNSYKVNGTAASATGYITYKSGGRSKVEAAFAREGGSWRISQMTVIYQ